MLRLSVDGLIAAASLVLLHEARNGRPPQPLARCMLTLGVTATPRRGRCLRAALGTARLGRLRVARRRVRRLRRDDHPPRAHRPASCRACQRTPQARQPPPAPRPARAPVTARDAERIFTCELAAGALRCQRAISATMHVGQDRARQLRAHVAQLAAASGQRFPRAPPKQPGTPPLSETRAGVVSCGRTTGARKDPVKLATAEIFLSLDHVSLTPSPLRDCLSAAATVDFAF
jgi:hypothetical protein